MGRAMKKAVYLVYSSRGEWWVDLAGKAFGPRRTREDATTEAIAMAQRAVRAGAPSEVLVPGDDQHYHVAWPRPEAARKLETTLAG